MNHGGVMDKSVCRILHIALEIYNFLYKVEETSVLYNKLSSPVFLVPKVVPMQRNLAVVKLKKTAVELTGWKKRGTV